MADVFTKCINCVSLVCSQVSKSSEGKIRFLNTTIFKLATIISSKAVGCSVLSALLSFVENLIYIMEFTGWHGKIGNWWFSCSFLRY